ncbi:hypothetical protein KCU98_g7600, partial [Aureobasidium melanogenum]
MAAKFAVSLMALLGAVSAQTGYTNSSSIATSTTSSASSTFSNGAVVTNAGVVFTIMDDTTYSDVTPLQLSRKRQAASGIGSCLNTCSDNAQCAGASYSDDTMRCSYYSQINQDSEASSPGTDFALVESRPGASSSANSTTSATGTHSATRPGVSGSSNSTGSATSSRPAGITGAGNSTSSRPTGSVSRTSSSATSAPSAPSTLLTVDGVVFLLEIDVRKSGITIELAILAKRAGQTLDQCLRSCAAATSCAATSFDDSTDTCTFYSSVDAGSAVADNNVDFATVISRAGQTGTGAGNNGTSAGNTTSPATNATAESFICPAFNAAILKSNTQVTFSISCSSFLIGTTFDLEASIVTKRQTFDNGLPQTLSNCVDLCSLSTQCVGATFEDATGQCTYYSAVQYSTVMAGFDSAVRVQNNAGDVVTTTTVIAGVTQTVTTTVPAGTTTVFAGGATSTATVYSTVTSVVTANGGGATALPSGATVTSIVSLTTTTYVNNVPTITLPQNYAAQTVTITQGAGAAAPTVTESVTVTVDGNGNVIGSSTAGAVAGGVAGNMPSYPTVTVYSSYCPTASAGSVVWTTVFV